MCTYDSKSWNTASATLHRILHELNSNHHSRDGVAQASRPSQFQSSRAPELQGQRSAHDGLQSHMVQALVDSVSAEPCKRHRGAAGIQSISLCGLTRGPASPLASMRLTRSRWSTVVLYSRSTFLLHCTAESSTSKFFSFQLRWCHFGS